MKHDLAADNHFAFGENWARYASRVGEAQIVEAETGLRRLLGGTDLAGKRFLDIGCGSGIHSLAALRLGAADVVSVDLDADSVTTTRALLERFASGKKFQVKQLSVHDLDAAGMGRFEVVYSWGVLHHTGDMRGALKKAAEMVADRGLFLFALYRRSWLCPLWRIEKKWYSAAKDSQQRLALKTYVFFFRLGLWATGRSLERYVEDYKMRRGMDYFHDVHDWLGGYPYESILPEEVEAFMREIGFSRGRSFLISRWRKPVKLFGSGCDEYAYLRP